MTYPERLTELREILAAHALPQDHPVQSPTEGATLAQAAKKTGLAGMRRDVCDVCGVADCGSWVRLPDGTCRDCDGMGWLVLRPI